MRPLGSVEVGRQPVPSRYTIGRAALHWPSMASRHSVVVTRGFARTAGVTRAKMGLYRVPELEHLSHARQRTIAREPEVGSVELVGPLDSRSDPSRPSGARSFDTWARSARGRTVAPSGPRAAPRSGRRRRAVLAGCALMCASVQPDATLPRAPNRSTEGNTAAGAGRRRGRRGTVTALSAKRRKCRTRA